MKRKERKERQRIKEEKKKKKKVLHAVPKTSEQQHALPWHQTEERRIK